MKVLTVRQPWARAIVSGGKTVENRTWTTPYRGRFAVHAGQTVDPAGLDMLGRDYGDWPRDLGHVLGTVELVSMHWIDSAPHSPGAPVCECSSIVERAQWAFVPMAEQSLAHWILANPIAFRTPIPAKGALQLWDAGPSLAYLIELAEFEGRSGA